MTTHRALWELVQRFGTCLRPPAMNQLYVRVVEDAELLELGQQLCAEGFGFHLVTLVGTDERELLEHAFKLTFLFSHPREDLFLFVEHPVTTRRGEDTAGRKPEDRAIQYEYASLTHLFEALDPLERELADLMGLYPRRSDREPIKPGTWLHECYPAYLYPLRRDRTNGEILDAIHQHKSSTGRQIDEQDLLPPGDGEWLLPVGPIHAAIIEPGRFLFRLAGEVIEELDVHLGYTHKGIERLFRTAFRLENGWKLAEHISGDSSFAHSMAYCQAAESLADVRPSPEAQRFRALFLELERIANHIGDCAALAHDVAFDLAASELAALRERLLQLHQETAGHRLLRGLNRPGGIVLPEPLDISRARAVVLKISARFVDLASDLAQHSSFRDRLQWIGILSQNQAVRSGATGLVARASGVQRDFRLQHPTGAYQDQKVQALIAQKPSLENKSIEARELRAGDCLARFRTRVLEVQSSAQIVDYLLTQPGMKSELKEFMVPIRFRPERNFEFGLGYVEGWRGDIIYWLMQDKFGRIYRCKVRDPSVLNWPALKMAVEPHDLDQEYIDEHKPPSGKTDSIVPDFPVINKSFNLSYSANDL